MLFQRHLPECEGKPAGGAIFSSHFPLQLGILYKTRPFWIGTLHRENLLLGWRGKKGKAPLPPSRSQVKLVNKF